MSFRCTLHPVDLRVAAALEAELRGETADWNILLRLWRKKQLINQINQPFKACLRDILADIPEFETELHIWGRPFLIYAGEAEAVSQKIAEYYGANNETEILKLYLDELRKFSEWAYFQKLNFKVKNEPLPDLGLKPVLRNLRQLYKKQQFPVLGGELGFILAQLLGVAYPYWYTDNYGLSFLKTLEFGKWEREPTSLAGLFSKLPEIGKYLPKRLERSLSVGIFLSPLEVREFLALLNETKIDWIRKMEEKQLSQATAVIFVRKVVECLTYAAGHGYGLLEATDVTNEEKVEYP